jgi:DNA-binding response OmpR family regulator
VLLSPTEFDLLLYLMARPNEVHSSRKLLQTVWGYPDGSGNSDVVRRHVKNIRDKIEPDPSRPRYIRTVGRHGYTVGHWASDSSASD